MSKKPIISKEAQVLLKLLRIALGTEEPNLDAAHAFPLEWGDGGRFWQEVIRLSYEHKVSALAADGLKKLLEAENVGDQISRLPDYPIIKTWFDDVKNVKYVYAYYVEVLKTLCQIFVDHGLTPIILKGYGLSLNYPIPSHRGAGDIDIFLIDKDGNPAAEKGDQIAREMLNLDVVRHGDEHHSSFTFKGILVENHHELRGKFLKTDAEEKFLQTLKDIVKKDMLSADGIPGAFYPSTTFNALFLMRHTIGNLHHGLINLRQLTDWVSFVKTHENEVDWQRVGEIQTKAGLSRFAADQNCFMVKYLGLSLTEAKATTEEKIINEIAKAIFNPVKVGETKIQRLTYYYRNRWIKKYFFGESWLKPLIQTILIHLHACR